MLKGSGTTQESYRFYSSIPNAHFFKAPPFNYSARNGGYIYLYLIIYYQKGILYQYLQVIQSNFNLCMYACVYRGPDMSMVDSFLNHPQPYFSGLGISLKLKLADSARVGSWSANEVPPSSLSRTGITGIDLQDWPFEIWLWRTEPRSS